MPLMIEYSSSILGGISDSTLICGIDSGARQVISLQLRHGRLITIRRCAQQRQGVYVG